MKRQNNKHNEKNFKLRLKTLRVMFTVCLLAMISVAGWRVDFFSIHSPKDILFCSPVPHGCKFLTEYIHSVEKTSVTDEYIISGGKIWTWEEQVSSSNAGMPSILPKYMQFLNNGEKLIFRGGRISSNLLYLRVGNESFGRNCAFFAVYPKIYLYKTFPGTRLTLATTKRNLLFCNRLAVTPFNIWISH